MIQPKCEWGLLGPEKLASERRVRTLGVGAAVRTFNDLAVPGMGNVFFGKQLFLATLGVAVAERLREDGIRAQNIETANAVEALACWLAFQNNDWASDPRLRGVTKMRHRNKAPLFTEARKRSFYVTQPMRMSTVQPLPGLGFVNSDSERFNAFSIAKLGQGFVEAVCEHFGTSYYTKNVLEHLVDWALGKALGRGDTLTKAISPVEPLPQKFRELLRSIIVRGDDGKTCRRKAILDWVERICSSGSTGDSWSTKPNELDGEHWRDLEAGAKFFETREAAIGLLDEVECHIGNMDSPKLDLQSAVPSQIRERCERLARIAREFLDLNHDPSPDQQPVAFCRECLDDTSVIANLVQRDGRVLRLSSHTVVPGPAFRGTVADEAEMDEETSPDESVNEDDLPPYISRRVGNMLLLSHDLHGKLDDYLKQ